MLWFAFKIMFDDFYVKLRKDYLHKESSCGLLSKLCLTIFM